MLNADTPRIAVICGGVGAARYLRGLIEVVEPSQISAIVNVADDMVLHGLHISPDIDTVTYTVSDRIDPERGWGVRNETWNAMEAISQIDPGADWFSLGDRDLGLHLYRTGRLADGATLTEVSAHIAHVFGLEFAVLPVSNHRVSTMLTVAGPDGPTEISFQEYFVGRAHDVDISSVRFDGAAAARATPEVLHALSSADRIVIAPSNPFVSIDPVLAVPGIRSAIADANAPVIGVSPIVGGSALKGPAARMLAELGHRVDAVGVAGHHRDILDAMVIDDVDAGLASDVATLGITPVVTDTIMARPGRAAALAAVTVNTSVRRRRRRGP